MRKWVAVQPPYFVLHYAHILSKTNMYPDQTTTLVTLSSMKKLVYSTYEYMQHNKVIAD